MHVLIPGGTFPQAAAVLSRLLPARPLRRDLIADNALKNRNERPGLEERKSLAG